MAPSAADQEVSTSVEIRIRGTWVAGPFQHLGEGAVLGLLFAHVPDFALEIEGDAYRGKAALQAGVWAGGGCEDEHQWLSLIVEVSGGLTAISTANRGFKVWVFVWAVGNASS